MVPFVKLARIIIKSVNQNARQYTMRKSRIQLNRLLYTQRLKAASAEKGLEMRSNSSHSPGYLFSPAIDDSVSRSDQSPHLRPRFLQHLT